MVGDKVQENVTDILGNKRNAPNIKLNHIFILALKDYMKIYV